MEWMDLLFREYADPFSLLDSVIPFGGFCQFIDTFQKKHEEKIRWEFYLYKLSAFDNRSWEEFNQDLDFGTAPEEPVKEDDLVQTVKFSFDIMKDFKLEGGEK